MGPDRFDERDTMFARAALEPGTPAYDASYARRPHPREVDDCLRALPPPCAPGGRFFEPRVMAAARVGSRCRIGAVTTALPGRPDWPVSLGVARFCELCGKCAHSYPASALATGPRQLVRGAWKWPTGVGRCYRHWRTVGTDCGVCMAVCPFSHADNAFHNVVRWFVRRLPWAHRALLAADDAVYGRRWRDAPGHGRS